jgi:hypothetical protein
MTQTCRSHLVFLRSRKTTIRGRGSIVGGTTNDMPPPPSADRLDPTLSYSRSGNKTGDLGIKSPELGCSPY